MIEHTEEFMICLRAFHRGENIFEHQWQMSHGVGSDAVQNFVDTLYYAGLFWRQSSRPVKLKFLTTQIGKEIPPMIEEANHGQARNQDQHSNQRTFSELT